MSKPKPDLAAQLRAAIAESGLSQVYLAAKSGIPQPHISRFLRDDERDISLGTADKLATAIGVRFTKPRSRKVTL